MKTRQLLAGGLMAAGLTAGGVAFAPLAGATDASVTYEKVCVNPSQGLWRATITFTNQWDGTTTVRLIEADGGSNFDESHILSGNGDTWTPTPFTVSYDKISVQASSDHPEHFHNNLPNQITRPAGCGTAPTTAPATTQPSTPPTTSCDNVNGPIHYPAGTPCPSPNTPVTGPGTPTTLPATTVAPTPTTPTTPATVKRSAGVPAAPVSTTPTRLPATGSSDTPVLLAALGALLAGGALLVAGRRGSAS